MIEEWERFRDTQSGKKGGKKKNHERDKKR